MNALADADPETMRISINGGEYSLSWEEFEHVAAFFLLLSRIILLL